MSQNYPKCSVLMCLYRGDKAEYFREAVESVFGQTVLPSELIVVVDGAIGDKLAEALNEAARKYKKVVVVKLQKNVGVGVASNEGLKHCREELVAKMDADDVMALNRIELQVAEFARDQDLTLLGGQLAEFSGDMDNIVSHRKVPITAKEIRKFARRRSPFNNQTVMYKKSAVMALGGYPKLNRAEDYYLYSKLIAERYKVKNLKNVLTYFRLDNEAIKRRRTWRHTKEMIKARSEIRKLGISNTYDVAITFLAQMVIFLTPAFVARLIYRRLRK